LCRTVKSENVLFDIETRGGDVRHGSKKNATDKGTIRQAIGGKYDDKNSSSVGDSNPN
jgi:hypothetical protein